MESFLLLKWSTIAGPKQNLRYFDQVEIWWFEVEKCRDQTTHVDSTIDIWLVPDHSLKINNPRSMLTALHRARKLRFSDLSPFNGSLLTQTTICWPWFSFSGCRLWHAQERTTMIMKAERAYYSLDTWSNFIIFSDIRPTSGQMPRYLHCKVSLLFFFRSTYLKMPRIFFTVKTLNFALEADLCKEYYILSTRLSFPYRFFFYIYTDHRKIKQIVFFVCYWR